MAVLSYPPVRTVRRSALAIGIVAVAALAFGPAGAVAAPSSAAKAACTATGPRDEYAGQDIDNDVVADVVIGIPKANAGAGVIDVRLSRSGKVQRVGQSFFAKLPPAKPGDGFGTVVQETDINADGCIDLVVGVPGANGGTGAVDVIFGSNAGLQPTGAFQLTGVDVGEHFGASLVIAPRYNDSDVPDGAVLSVGAPDRTVDGAVQAGAVDQFQLSSSAVVVSRTAFSQNTPGIAGASETDDHFGAVLSLDIGPDQTGAETSPAQVLVGIPDEDIGSKVDAGMVTQLPGLEDGTVPVASQSWTQDSAGVAGVSEAGDHFGAAIAGGGGDITFDPASGIFVGAPGEDLGSIKDAGVVDELGTTAHPGVSYTQDTPGIPGAAEAGDQFGASLAITLGLTCGSEPPAFLEVGSPGEDLGTIKDAGDVTGIALLGTDPDPEWVGCLTTVFYQGKGGLGGAPEAGDRLGATLSAADNQFYEGNSSDAFLVGVPGEDVGSIVDAGVTVEGSAKYGVGGTPPASYSHTTFEDSAGPIAGEQYGLGVRPA